jgi:RNA polymerase sigma-70 factor, ECF subfamily
MKLTREAQLELVSKARRGDAAAFGELYEAFGPYVRAAVRRICPPDDIEDQVQGVFLHVFQKLDSFKGEADFSTWLYRVAHNYALRQLRQHHHDRDTVSFDQPDGDHAATPEPSYEDRAIEGSMELAHLQEAIDKLKPREATFIRLQLMGYSNAEIAELTASTVLAVKSELFRAKKELAVLLGAALPKSRVKYVRHKKETIAEESVITQDAKEFRELVS